MTDKDKTTIDIGPQRRWSEDDVDIEEEPPVTANMLPSSQLPQPPFTQGATFGLILILTATNCRSCFLLIYVGLNVLEKHAYLLNLCRFLFV